MLDVKNYEIIEKSQGKEKIKIYEHLITQIVVRNEYFYV
jgi:hypothetical protein